MRRGLILFLWTTAILAVLAGGSVAFAEQTPSCQVFVQPGESIQAAIDAALEGAVICLAAGEWQEDIAITKSLTLMGQRGRAPGSDLHSWCFSFSATRFAIMLMVE
jgi:pectin methylesterase-like acyl-CoA thioesterase